MPLEVFSEINFCKHVYLREISEPADNQLRLVLEEATPARKLESLVVAGVEFSDLRALESTEYSKLFSITWDAYISYSVRNESLTAFDEYEVVELGRIACVYSKSRFLDYVASSTIATKEVNEPIQHVGIHCLNHIIDVASVKMPMVRELRQQHSPHMVV